MGREHCTSKGTYSVTGAGGVGAATRGATVIAVEVVSTAGAVGGPNKVPLAPRDVGGKEGDVVDGVRPHASEPNGLDAESG